MATIVVEDPSAANGVREYHPAAYGYDEVTQMWEVTLETDEGPDVSRQFPSERVVYIETAATTLDGGQ